MQVNFLNPVLNACQNVMASMADLRLQTGKPAIRQPAEPEAGHTITGIICMKSTDRCASIAIILTDTVLENISLRMLPDDAQQNEALAFDLVGEISNLIIGGAKTMLIQEGYRFDIALPTVINGYDYLIAHQTKAPILRIPLGSDIGTFFIESSFEVPPLSKQEKLDKPQAEPADTSMLELF